MRVSDRSAEGKTVDPWGGRVLFIVCFHPIPLAPHAWALSLVFFHPEYEILTPSHAIRCAPNEDADRNEPAGSLRTGPN